MRLSPARPGGNVTHYRISADSRAVVFRADLELDQRFELFAVPAGGGAARVDGTEPVRLLRSSESETILEAIVAAGKVVLLRELELLFDGLDRSDLFAVPVDGSAPPRLLSRPFAPGPIDERVSVFTAAGASAAYLTSGANGRELHGVAIDGGSPPVQSTGKDGSVPNPRSA